MKVRSETVVVAALACLGSTIIGCERKPQETKPRSTTPVQRQAVTLPPNLFVAEAPAGARSVAEVKGDPNAKGDVVVRGRIGGRREPFVDGAAVFLLADVSMKPCNELHGDGCPTPWDYCCEPRESLVAKVATVQVVGSDGKPLRASLIGQHGLTPLAEVIVAGDVAKRDDAGTLVINARTIHVKLRGG